MPRLVLPFLLLALMAGIAPAAPLDEARQDCRRAAAAYDAGDFEDAAMLYESARDQGLDAAVVHYNLGNARFKQGQLGEAIASYLRASRIDPRDPQIRTNLSRARAQIKDVDLSGGDLPPVLKPFQWGYARFSANEWLGLALVLVLLLSALRIVNQWRPVRASWLSPATRTLTVLLLLAGLAGSVRHHVDFGVDRGVVVAEEVQVRSGPGNDYNLAFRVHEGLPVRVAEAHGDWFRIDLGGELVGWVPAATLELL